MVARRVDWSFGPGHGPISGVINAAGSAMAATMVAELANTPPLWGLVGGAFAAAGSTIAAAWDRAPGRALAYRAACWLAAGGWSTWALALPDDGPWSGPWSNSALASLAIGTLTAGLAGVGLAHADRREEDRQIQAAKDAAGQVRPADAKEDQVAARWTALLRRITMKPVTVVGVELWETGTGHTLAVTLPEDGTTIDDIKRQEKALATAANLPPGCNVEVLATSEGRRTILVRVATESALGEDHHLPEDYSAESIQNDISLGIVSDRSAAAINLRYSCAVLVGQTDSGKSNQLNVITTGLVRCTDALVWAIDVSGNGRYPRPWDRAWHEGRAPVPAIDWVAPTSEEAELMLLAAIQIIDGRTAEYDHRMVADGEDKIMVAPDLPEIVIVIDEFGKLPEALKQHITTISDTGRGAGVRTVSCALEAKANYIPRSVIVQARERIAMRVTDEAELQYLFDSTWSRGRFDPASIPYKGSGLWATGAVAPEPFKGWRMEPARIDRASIAVADLRPELDEVSVRLGDTVIREYRTDMGKAVEEIRSVYTDRWKRTRHIIFPTGGGSRSAAGSPMRPAGAAEAGSVVAETKEQPVDLAAARGNLDATRDAARRAAEEAETARASGAGQELPELPEPADFSVVESWLRPGASATNGAGRRKPHPRIRMHQIVWDSGKDGTGPGSVHKVLEAEEYDTVYQTVVDWMRADAAKDVLSQPGGKKTAYYAGPKMADPYDGLG